MVDDAQDKREERSASLSSHLGAVARGRIYCGLDLVLKLVYLNFSNLEFRPLRPSPFFRFVSYNSPLPDGLPSRCQ